MIKVLQMKSKFFINLILMFCILMFSFLITLIKDEYKLYFIFFLGLSLIIFFYLQKNIEKKDEFSLIFRMCIIAFTFRVFIVIMCTVFPSLTVPSDAQTYENNALKIIENFNSGIVSRNIFTSHFLYYIYNAVIYYLFGFFPSLARILNCFFGVLAGINIYFLVKKPFGATPAKISIFLLLFFPSIIFWSTLNLKEATVYFLFSVIIRNLVELNENPRIVMFLKGLVFCILLTLTRSYAGILMTVILSLYFMIVSKYRLLIKFLTLISIIIAVGLVTSKTGMGFFGLDYIKSFNLSYIDAIRKSEYRGGSEVLQNVSMSTPIELLKFLPVSILYFLFSPFPWQVGGSFIQFFSLIQNIIYDLLFISLIIGSFVAFKKDKLICIIINSIILLFVLFYSISLGNMGLAFRFKDMLFPMVAIFASVGISKVNEKMMKKISS